MAASDADPTLSTTRISRRPAGKHAMTTARQAPDGHEVQAIPEDHLARRSHKSGCKPKRWPRMSTRPALAIECS